MYSLLRRMREDGSQAGDVDSDGFHHRWRCSTGENQDPFAPNQVPSCFSAIQFSGDPALLKPEKGF